MHAHVAATVAIGAIAALMPDSAALACRGGYHWSTGADPSKLKPSEVAIRAKFLTSYKSEQRFEHSIMGHPYGMIYLVEVFDVIGMSTSTGEDQENLEGKRIFVHSGPSVCEQYRPRKFAINVETIFVLRMMRGSNLYELVGGQE